MLKFQDTVNAPVCSSVCPIHCSVQLCMDLTVLITTMKPRPWTFCCSAFILYFISIRLASIILYTKDVLVL